MLSDFGVFSKSNFEESAECRVKGSVCEKGVVERFEFSPNGA